MTEDEASRTDPGDASVRRVPVDGAANMRDCGGLPVAGGGRVRPRVLLRSDNLQDLTQADVALLREGYRLRRVVDLRTATEREAEQPTPLERVGVDHRYLTLITEADWKDSEEVAALPDAERAQVLADRLGRRAGWLHTDTPVVGIYLGYLDARPDNVVAAVRTIAEPDGATLVHCAAGKDRTGMVVALALSAVGVPHEHVVGDYAASADNIEAILDRLVGRSAYTGLDRSRPQLHTPQARSMAVLMDELDAGWGGAAGWLRAAGMTDDELRALADRLVER